jgi:uncharacterized protein (DUF362 family)
VAVVRVSENYGDPIRKALNLISEPKHLKSPVLIKPNICVDHDRSGESNTGTRIVEAVIKEILKKDEKITIRIVESDSGGKLADEAFEKLGYRKLEEKFREKGFDVKLVNLSREETALVNFNGLYFKQLRVPKILLQPKYFISIPKAKMHSLTYITGALKNQFGCLPEKGKDQYHRYINEVIVDINKLIKPDLNIIDGRVWMEGVVDGPIKKLGVLICSKDPVAADAIMARLVNFNPEKIKHVSLAEKHGVGSMNPTVLGERIENLKINSRKPSRAIALFETYAPKTLHQIAVRIYRKIKR